MSQHKSLLVDPSTANILLPVLLAKEADIPVVYEQGTKTTLVSNNGNITENVTDELLSSFGVTEWMTYGKSNFGETLPYAKLLPILQHLDHALKFKTFFENDVTYSASDLLIFASLKANTVWAKLSKDSEYHELKRWYSHMLGLLTPIIEEIASKKGRAKDQASYDIELKDAEYGRVVTRFPPEPSGYLHIGHAKAAMLNEYFARKYGGKLIVRFDDTNPTKETCEFEDSILEDLQMMGIKGDVVTHTSDYFEQLLELAVVMIKEGKAYADDTPQEQMGEQRGSRLPSTCRDNPSEESLRRLKEMQAGSEEGLKNCIRAKISYDAPNGALRDPVMLRCNLIPHHRTGTKFHVYPTYDFACPVVDSIEGVTHALRTSEYHDRNEQYSWFQSAMNLRQVHIWDYSRLNFVYTLLSKRKLAWFVEQKRVEGWDDPRFPTIRGILRRGLTMPALREYILMQGPSKNTLLLEWDKLWAVNKKLIEPVAPRYTAIEGDDAVELEVTGGELPFTRSIPLHKKNPDIGNKTVTFSNVVLLEQTDAKECNVNEEVTLMDWGNLVITDIRKQDGKVTGMSGRLNPTGDVKSTQKKLTWLSKGNSTIPITLYTYHHLITKRKLEENDDIRACLNPVTETTNQALGDANLASCKKGDIVQLERKGFYIMDQAHEEGGVRMIAIPDGKSVKGTTPNDK